MDVHPRVLISAGDPSGDIYGEQLAIALQARLPSVRVYGIGGPRLAEACDLVLDTQGLSAVGLAEVLSVCLRGVSALRKAWGAVEVLKPHVGVLIDFPEFNMRLAKALKQVGSKTIYFCPPAIWASRPHRGSIVHRIADVVAAALPMDYQAYTSSGGARTVFVGHPALDRFRGVLRRDQARAELGVSGDVSLLALFPGSRDHEVKRHLPLMAEAARIMVERDASLQLVVSAVRGVDDRQYTRSGLRCVYDRPIDILIAADASIVKSGTSTLEAAVARCPMVVVYRTSRMTWQVLSPRLQVNHIALPNILAGRSIVPELIQDAAAPNSIASCAMAILGSAELNDRIRHELDAVVERLGGPGATDRCADIVVDMLAHSH